MAFNLRPFNTVDNKEFRHLISVLDPTAKVMGRKKFMGHLSSKASMDRQGTFDMFKDAKYIATSADIWSCSNHGYMGMTATTILSNFERMSRAIACKHFVNPHTGARIAGIIGEVHQSYGLDLLQLVGTITDNGGNMVKAFGIAAIDANVVLLLEELEGLYETLPKHQR